jgi:filamentous hemagglutinin
MDVRQFAFLARQPSAQLTPRKSFLGVSKRALAVLMINVVFWQPIWAQAGGIVVSGGTKTTVGQAGNGVTVINIAKPNGSGLSHNQFTDYNVDKNGVILNNSTKGVQNTQLGGYITGNSQLGGKAAGIILNEVTGGSASQLKGYTEVAGQAARVIVANPYGVTCNGCGFINTPRVTLSTGKPVLDGNGKLDHFQVDGGSVNIEGDGLNASNVDQFDIITRSAKINADIYAKKLNIVAGANDVNADTLATTARAGNAADKPELAIDSSALGGMYANTIKLVGTEQGVGVKLAGDMAASAGDMQIDANGHLTMARLAATGAVKINAASLDAQESIYAGTSADIKTRGTLNNQKVLAARDSITLTSDGELNNSGTLQAGINADNSRNAKGDVTLDAKTINNTGNVIASRNLSAKATQTLTNNGGIVAAGQTLSATAATLDNQNKGQILSDASMKLTADNLRNTQGGYISSGGALTATAGAISNRGGVIESGTTLDVSAGSLDNTAGQISSLGRSGKTRFAIGGQLDNSSGTLETANTDLSLAASNFQNLGGSVLHVGSGALDLEELNLNNAGGSIVTQGDLTFKKAAWTNSSVIQANHLNLDVDSFEQASTGQLLGTDSFVGKGLNWTTGGVIASDGGVDLTITDQLNNTGRITSATRLDVNAARVSNLGTLAAGQVLAVSTGSLLNDHALIFSGGNISLRVDQLSNRYSDIYALGNLSVDRDGLGGLASLISNSSSNMQADGTLSLAASTIENVRTILTVESGIYSASITPTACIEGVTGGDCEGGKENRVFLISQRDHLAVTDASAASSITSGGSMLLTGGSLLNSSSSIAAGGDLTAIFDQVTNTAIETHDTQIDRVFATERTRHPAGWNQLAADFTRKYSQDSASYDKNALGGLEADLAQFIGTTQNEVPSQAQTTQLVVPDQSYSAVIQAGGAVNIQATNGIDNTVVRGGYTYVGSGAKTDTNEPGYSTVVTLNPQLPPDQTQQPVNPIDLPGFQLPTSQFASNPQKYLIESDPAFTNLGQFMSSDYMLDKLGYNPDDAQKRLGDGYYEQKLIQQAVIARTGQRFIDGQTSDAGLFKYLMDNGISSQAALNLSVGVSLTGEQVAALTHDIVWMEQHEVAGEKVLVPVLYMAQANNRLAPNGALITGSDVTLISGQNLNNSGTLRATNNLGVSAGGNLTNAGLVEAGNLLQLRATNNLTNTAGGVIAGRNVDLVAVNGDLLNERSVTTHQSDSGYRTERTQFVDSAARIEAAEALTMQAGRDVNNIGSVIKSGDDTTIQAGRDVNIVSAQQDNSGAIGSRSNHQNITQYGSVVDAGRDFQVVAARNISAVASQISAQRDLTLDAAENLNIASAADEQHSYSKTKKVTSQEDHVSQVSSVLKAGGDVSLTAGQDMAMMSSKITAGKQAYVYAGNTLSLGAAQDSDYSLYDMKKKGSFGAKKTQRDEVTKVNYVGTEINTGGNLVLASGGDQLYQVAKLNSGKDLTLESGGAITFEGVKDLHQESHEKSSSSLVWNSMKGKGHTDETLRQTQLIAQGAMAIKAVDGLKIDIKQVDQQTVSQTIDAMVKADPQLAWLKDAEKRGDVDWKLIKETHDSFKYSHSSLGQGAMLAIIIVVTIVTAGAASGFAGAAAGATAGSGSAMAAAGTTAAIQAGTAAAAGWGNVMATAALTSMASTGAVSVINNKGNLGAALSETFSSDSLKNAAVSSLTAGFTSSVIDPQLGGTTKAYNNLTKGFDLSTLEGMGGFAVHAGAQGLASGTIKTAINGGSLGDNVVDDLVYQAGNVAGAIGFNYVGSFAQNEYLAAAKDNDSVGKALWAEGGAARTAMHAFMGGAMSSATGGDFTTGAVAAGASQAMAGVLNEAFEAHPEFREGASQIVGLTAAGLAGGDVNTAWRVAQIADQYNRQLHNNESEALTRLRKENPQTADRLDAAACALVKCSASVPSNDPNYDKLRSLEIAGASYTTELNQLKATGVFSDYSTWDKTNDALLKNDEAIKRSGNTSRAIAGAVGAVGGYAGAVATAPACISIIGCAAPALSLAGGTYSAMDGWEATGQIFAPYNGTQGANVVASMDINTYPGDVSPMIDYGTAAAKVAMEVALGKVGGKLASGEYSILKVETKASSGIAKNSAGEITTISDEMRADVYHPDWKQYVGTEPRGVGADSVKAGEVTKTPVSAAAQSPTPQTAADDVPGSFSITDWAGYPSGVPQPEGPFRLLEGTEYSAARSAANKANATIRREQGLVGQPVDVHEINPVKFGGSPSDSTNKIVLPRDVHRQQVTPWWNQLQKDLGKQ